MTNPGTLAVQPAHSASIRAYVVSAISAVLLFGAGSTLQAAVAAGAGLTYVPASAHAVGVNGVNWRTDVEVHNPGTSAATFTVELLKQNTDNGGVVPSRNLSLGPQTSTRYTDILASLFGVEGAAALRFTTTSGTILVTSRTYNLVGPNSLGLPVGASFGQFVPGLSTEEAIAYGEEGRLIQLTQQAASTLDGFRTNIGIVNATGQTIDVTIDLYGADGSLLGSVSGDDTRLRPYEFRQLNAVFGRFTASSADGYAVVKTTTSGGRLFAFASVVDNHASGDPIFVPATRLSGGSAATPVYVPASAHAVGVNGVNWRTDVEVHNPGTSAATFTVELLKQNTDNGGVVPSRNLSLGPQTSTRYTDILASLFGVEGAAALRFTTTSGTILVTSRTYNLVGPNSLGLPVGASFGQFVPGLSTEEAIAYGEEGRLIQQTQQAASTLDGFRTNVGIVNATGQTIDVTIDLYGADGSLLGSVSGDDTRLRPYEFRQLNAIFGRFTASSADGYAVVKTTTSGGRLFAFASVVDNHASGDPIFLPAATIPPPGPLAIFAPSLEAPLLSGVPASLQVGARRASEAPLTFTLLEGPAGAAIDAGSGRITWTPPASAEGTQVRFRVNATDGQTTPEVVFTVPVASTSSVATSLSSSTLTINQSGTLQGISFTLPAQLSRPASELHVASVTPGQAAPIPEGVVRLSDFFRVTPVEASGEDGITVTLPARLVPSGVRPSELLLFFYLDQIDGLDGPAWVGIANELDVLPGGNVTIKLHAFESLCFVGYRTPSSAHLVAQKPIPPGETLRLEVGALAVSVGCAGKQLADGTVDPNRKVCTVTGDDFMTVTVTNFDPNPWQPAATLEEMIGWLVAGRQKLLSYGMSASPVFEVVVEPMPKPTTLGFVASSWSGKVERRRVLHLSNAAQLKANMQGSTVHEYFHHAQSRTRVAGKTNVFDTVGKEAKKWLYEGTARWFEDEVFDDLDSYKLKEANPLLPVLGRGLDAWDSSNVLLPATSDPYTRAYARFGFFKMVSGRCPGFSLPQAFNWDAGVDPTGIDNLAAGLASADWRCDFGPGFGDANKASLASAFLYYLHATQKQSDVARLDPNESGLLFVQSLWKIAPAECPRGGCPTSANTGLKTIKKKTAWALEVRPIASLAADKEVALEVEIGAPPVWVWIGDDAPHRELGQGTWFNARGVNRYVYGQQGSAPKLFVAIVNPSLDRDADVTVRAIIRPSGTASVRFPFSLSSTSIGLVSELQDAVTWTITSSGNISGPVGTTLGNTYVGSWLHRVEAQVSGARVPFAFGVTGTFDAVVSPQSGSAQEVWGTDVRSWAYSNKRLKLNCNPEEPPGEIVTTTSLNLEKTATTAQSGPTGWVPCILYDLKYEERSPTGALLTSWTKTIEVAYLNITFYMSGLQ